MKSLRRAGIAGLGLIALAWASAQPASAQYYGGQGYGYERRSGEGYERRSRDGYERRDFDRRDSRRYDDRGSRYGGGGGYGRDDGRGRGYGRQQNPMAGMSLEEQKRAVKNEREAQKKAFKRGQLFR
ncbi:hypothetical protein [Bosea sp. ANAM02]|uniref:hypothetical protein n=1 Tax=Bosea sp. ANAM02 TaxID=2020412 RepID=UPI000647D2FC|nr:MULTISPECIES: hypothetical protein [Hyphomicrobiales]BCB20004.1 hypothetical protein OCUBac02_28980 [Bosea sp. ANAM02]